MGAFLLQRFNTSAVMKQLLKELRWDCKAKSAAPIGLPLLVIPGETLTGILVANSVQNKTALNSDHFLSAHHKSQLYLFCKITNLTLSFAASRSRRQASLQFRCSWWKSVLLSENHNCSRHLVGNNIILFRNKHNFSFFFCIYLIFYPNLEETTKKRSTNWYNTTNYLLLHGILLRPGGIKKQT